MLIIFSCTAQKSSGRPSLSAVGEGRGVAGGGDRHTEPGFQTASVCACNLCSSSDTVSVISDTSHWLYLVFMSIYSTQNAYFVTCHVASDLISQIHISHFLKEQTHNRGNYREM